MSGYVVVPECGTAPCRVWNVNYTAVEGDYGAVSFVFDYVDSNHRPGTARDYDAYVQGKVVITSFACEFFIHPD